MAKKRQIDFQKTKLRVGKTLPKGRNVTDTSFKTRKIATRDQIKSVTGEVTLKDILNYLGHNNVSVKKENLAKLTNYIIDNKDSLTLFFPDVLKRTGAMLMDSDHGIRMVVIDVMHTALRFLSDTQVGCFFTPLTSYMHCMLTHCDTAVRRDSLKLLDQVLSTHPAVFCRASTVLQGLLNLISSATHKGKKRRLNEHISSTVSSQQIRAEVLSHILSFLECLFVPKEEEEDEDEREVYWDAKEPLYLPLYLRGGTTPVPLEAMKADLNQNPTSTQEFKDFVSDLLPLLFDIIKGEIRQTRSPSRDNTLIVGQISDNPVNSSVVSNLNVVVQLLCYVGEWIVQEAPFEEAKDKEFKDLITKMVIQLFAFFPYQQLHEPHKQRKSETKKEASCLLLNLGVSYIYCMFVLDTDKYVLESEKMMTYLDEGFNMCNGMGEKSISLFIKLTKICLGSNVNPVYKNGLLLGLFGVLDSHKLSPCAKQLYSFFMNISLDYEFKNLLDCEAMRTWFNLLIKEIIVMVETNTVNRRFFKYVRQICARKYPYFLDQLNKSNPENFLELFKYEDEDLHLTVTQMITCLDQPCTIVLDGLIDVISDPSFNMKSATRIIRQLHARFSGPRVPAIEKLFFVKFLLNLGCDSLSLADPSSEVIIPDLLKSVMESCRFSLKPSSKWERHLKITEVCFECLPCYLETDALVLKVLKFLDTVLYQYQTIPVHSAVALLKLRKVAFEIELNEDLMGFFGELLFSSLMYLSVMLSEESKGEDLKPYAMTELKNSLGLEREDVNLLIQIIKINIHSFGEMEMYHVLRVTQFLIHVNILTFEDRKDYFHILESINSTWHRSNILHPLWTNICKFFRLL